MSDATNILIIGGGPVALSLALDLAWRGNRSILVERDPATGHILLAKANGLHERTMETVRRWGLKDEVNAVAFPPDQPGDSVYCTTMTGHFIGQSVLPSTDTRPIPPESPEKRQRCPQYEFDPLLARAVLRKGLTDIRYGTEFVSAKEMDGEVVATLREVDTGRTYEMTCQYLVGCDGAGSRVRRMLDIPFEGPMLDFSLSAMIRVTSLPEDKLVAIGERYLLLGTHGTWGIMTKVDGHQIWRYTVVGSQDKLDPERYDIASDIRKAFGPAPVEFEILRLLPWKRSQCVAARYREGRILLAGDSAHTTSPTGGHGMNTGIADAMDLSWMLDGLIKGWGGDHLLDAYDLERRPVGVRNSAIAAGNYSGWVDHTGYDKILDTGAEGDAARADIGRRLVASLHGEWNSIGVNLGIRYENSPIIVPDGSPQTTDETSNYIQTARPGHRAPHAWLEDGRSTLDLFGHGFVLLRFDTAVEASVLKQKADAVALPLTIIDISDSKIADLYETSLVLIRPDGVVAWRGDALPGDSAMLIDVVRGAITMAAAASRLAKGPVTPAA